MNKKQCKLQWFHVWTTCVDLKKAWKRYPGFRAVRMFLLPPGFDPLQGLWRLLTAWKDVLLWVSDLDTFLAIVDTPHAFNGTNNDLGPLNFYCAWKSMKSDCCGSAHCFDGRRVKKHVVLPRTVRDDSAWWFQNLIFRAEWITLTQDVSGGSSITWTESASTKTFFNRKSQWFPVLGCIAGAIQKIGWLTISIWQYRSIFRVGAQAPHDIKEDFVLW